MQAMKAVLAREGGTAAEKQRAWEKEVREVLQAYEKAERKNRYKKINGLRAHRDKLLKEAAGKQEGSAKRRGLEEQAARRDRQIQVLKMQEGMAEAERERQRMWGRGKDLRTTHEDLRGGGKIAKRQDILRMTHPEKGEVTDQAGIREVLEKHMGDIFNLDKRGGGSTAKGEGKRRAGAEAKEAKVEAKEEKAEAARRAAAKKRVLARVRAHVATLGKEVTKAMEALSIEAILSVENIRKAIAEIKKGTVPGEDGFGTDFYSTEEVTTELVGHLRELYDEIGLNKLMPTPMRNARVSVLHKGRGKPENQPKSYRPIAVTAATYRILLKAVQLKLAPAVTAVIGKTQMAYMTDGRRIWDNTLLLAEIARTLEAKGKGGAALQVDNTAAFDRVRWDFLHEILEAMGFPEEFREFMKIIYTDLRFSISLNGVNGEMCSATNGVRQGCPASPLMFNLVQEALLISIRGDAQLRGVEIVTRDGKVVGEVRERCMADDTVVYLREAAQAERLFEIIDDFVLASGQLLNSSKSVGVLFGEEKRKPLPEHGGIRWIRFGEEMVEEGLGVVIGTEEQVRAQWKEDVSGVMKSMRERLSQSRDEWGTTARARAIQSAYVSKLVYKMQVQAPQTADEEMARAQAQMDAALFEGSGGQRGYYFVTRGLATQKGRDGGLGQVDLECRLEAAWAELVLSLSGRPEPWKKLWTQELEEVYGGLEGGDLGHTTCGFQKYFKEGKGSEVLRRGLMALAKLPAPVGRVRVPEAAPEEGTTAGGASGERGRGGAASSEDGGRSEGGAKRVKYTYEDVGAKEWTAEEVKGLRLFFNPFYSKGTRLSGRSDLELEIEATKWSRVGLRRWGDVVVGSSPLDMATFRKRYMFLDASVYADLLRELHPEWLEGLAREDAVHTGRVEAVCCWHDVTDQGAPLGQYVWELFSVRKREGLAKIALRAMRRACDWEGEGVELQVREKGNEDAVGCYTHMGARFVARQLDGIMVGDAWREPSRGNVMMRFEASALDARLAEGVGGGDKEIYVADSLEELRERGLLEDVRGAAVRATAGQGWRRDGGKMPCLRDGGDAGGCRYVIILREDGEAGAKQDVPTVVTTLTRRSTLTPGQPIPTDTLRIAAIYEALVAEKWELPGTFAEGRFGQLVWARKGRRGGEERLQDIAKVYAGLRHPAVPFYMSDRAYKAATGTEFAGKKLLGMGGMCWRCGCSDGNTLHRFHGCAEVRKLWELVFQAWYRISGGERLDPGDEWLTLWAARWATWKDEKEQEAYGGEGLEEVFQVIHKATIQAIHEAATRKDGRKMNAQHMYTGVQGLVHRLVEDRARSATASLFNRTWMAPGYAKRVGKLRVLLTAGMWAPNFKRKGDTPQQSGAAQEKEREANEAAAKVLQGAVEVYTDGSGQDEGAGWGWVAVRGGDTEIKARKGPVVLGRGEEGWRGAERGTNNTGELTAILEALEWAADEGLSDLVVRYDSEYAAYMTRGMWRAKKNKELVGQCRRTYERLTEAGCSVKWWHVRGHSGNVWNTRADRLADSGVKSPPGGVDVEVGQIDGGVCTGGVQGVRPCFTAGGGKAGSRVEPTRLEGGGVRWVTYVQTTARRVLRSSTGFGALNMPTPKQPVPPSEVALRARRVIVRLRQEAMRGESSPADTEMAVGKIKLHAARLAMAAEQRKEIQAMQRPKAVRSVDCDLSTAGLEAYVAATGGGQADLKKIRKVLAKAKTVGPGVVRLRIDYAYSPLGRALVEAGHCTGSRVNAIGVDPFKGWTRALRGAAFHDMGWEADDVAAFPAAKVAMVPVGREVTTTFLEHREAILKEVGDALFPEVTSSEEKRGWAKQIFSSYDNDASLEGWKKTVKGDPKGRSVGGMAVRVGGEGGRPKVDFKPADYRKAQLDSSLWMWDQAGEEVREFLTERTPPKDRKKIRELRLKWKSYVLQEAESAAREGKVGWALSQGIPVLSLQHDCVVLGRRGVAAADEQERLAYAEGLSRAATEATSYRTTVKVKWSEEIEAVAWVD